MVLVADIGGVSFRFVAARDCAAGGGIVRDAGGGVKGLCARAAAFMRGGSGMGNGTIPRTISECGGIVKRHIQGARSLSSS
jgi:hypothetical protein